MSVVGARRLPRSNIMQNIYAATPKALIYHLLAEYHRTLCGLYIVGELHLFAGKPKDRILCKHCEDAASHLSSQQVPETPNVLSDS